MKKKKAKRASAAKPDSTNGAKPVVTITTKGSVTQDLETIFRDGVLLDLQIGFWSAKRRNTVDDLGIEQDDVPEFVIGLGTKRLIKKELIDSWQQLAAKARYVVRRHSFVFPIGDTSFVPINSLPVIEEELVKLKQQFEAAGENLWKNYDKIRDAMLREFPEHRQALARLYPPRDQVRRAFYFTWDVFNVTLPRKAQLEAFDRKKVAEGEKVLARYRTQLEQRMTDFVADVVGMLRAKVITVSQTIMAKIKSGDVVSNQSINSLHALIARFREMNFPGDQRIETMLTSLEKEVLGDRDAAAFKDNDALQKTLVKTLDGLVKAAEAVTDISEITGGLRRKIRI